MLQAMNPYIFLPIAIGISVIIQSSMNKELALQSGMAAAIVINSIVVLIFSIVMSLLISLYPNFFPSFFYSKSLFQDFNWKYIVPGAAGFFIVLGLPWSMAKLNPSDTFIIFVTTQILLSLALESLQNGQIPSVFKLLGVAFALIGGFLVVKF